MPEEKADVGELFGLKSKPTEAESDINIEGDEQLLPGAEGEELREEGGLVESEDRESNLQKVKKWLGDSLKQLKTNFKKEEDKPKIAKRVFMLLAGLAVICGTPSYFLYQAMEFAEARRELEEKGVYLDSAQPKPLSQLLDEAVSGPNGSIELFKSGAIDLDILHPWDDVSVWDAVAGGGALAPFVQERDGYIDQIFGEDVDTGNMTKKDLKALLGRARDKGLMTEDEVLFYLVRFQFGNDGVGFWRLIEKGDPEALRALQSKDSRVYGKTKLTKREIRKGEWQQNKMVTRMIRKARTNRF